MSKKLALICCFPGVLLAARFVPFERLPSTCLFFQITGYPCPTCGMTRSIIALTRLDFERAFRLNALAPIGLAIFGLWWGLAVNESISGRKSSVLNWARRKNTLLLGIALIVLFAFGIARVVVLMRL